MRRVLLEVAIAGPEDAVAAESGGADRLELSSGLELGGLTPSLGLLRETVQASRLPVWVLLRPRPGGFVYNPADSRVITRDLDLCLEYGAAGCVVGALDGHGAIDVARCQAWARQAGGERLVFHRAFDLATNATAALETLVDLGYRRILTSGQAATALAGADLLAALIGQARGRIEILPAAGITSATVEALVARTGCDQVHGSFSGWRIDASGKRGPVDFGQRYRHTDAEHVGRVRALLG